MKTIFFSFLLFAASIQHCSAQDLSLDITYSNTINPPDNSLIYYSGKPLSIEDFKGTPVANGDAVAITSSGFSFKAAFHNTAGKSTASIIVFCSFDKNKSWMNEKGKNAYILKHEQQHFNISYIGTLLFIKKMKATKFSAKNFNEQIQKIYYAAAADMEKLQNKYDDETSNGRIADKQALWEDKIAAQLQNLQAD